MVKLSQTTSTFPLHSGASAPVQVIVALPLYLRGQLLPLGLAKDAYILLKLEDNESKLSSLEIYYRPSILRIFCFVYLRYGCICITRWADSQQELCIIPVLFGICQSMLQACNCNASAKVTIPCSFYCRKGNDFFLKKCCRWLLILLCPLFMS